MYRSVSTQQLVLTSDLLHASLLCSILDIRDLVALLARTRRGASELNEIRILLRELVASCSKCNLRRTA